MLALVLLLRLLFLLPTTEMGEGICYGMGERTCCGWGTFRFNSFNMEWVKGFVMGWVRGLVLGGALLNLSASRWDGWEDLLWNG